MPKLIFTPDEIAAYAREDKNIEHVFRQKNIEAADRILVHADGKFPEKLIRERRPNEPLAVMEYREKIFVEKTKPIFSKVFSSLQKIRRSSEWVIKHVEDSEFTRIKPEETLAEYCEKRYPFFTSITNWAFDVLLRKYLTDPNAVGFVYPLEWGNDVEENEYVRPICEIFGSHDVIDFVPEDYAVMNIPAGSIYYVDGMPIKGKSFYVVTTQRVMRYDESNNGDFLKQLDWVHGLDELPVFQIKAIVVEPSSKGFRYESRIAAMLPELDEAIREYSDLQAAKVLHIYPERWEYMQNECKLCKGKGLRPNPAYHADCKCEQFLECSKCDGTGYIAAGPYSKIMVKPASAIEGQQAVPTPPAGYIDKDTTIVEIQEQGVKMHLYNALAAINYEHLAETPLVESGVAKEQDKDEANNWTHSVSEDIVAFIDTVYYFIAWYRYKVQYSKAEIIEMLPAINVPERFDLVSSARMQEELRAAKEGKFNPLLLSALEDHFAAVRFATEPEVRERLQLIFKLDPFPNVSAEDKMVMLSNDGISKEMYIISCNINEFIQRALEDDEDFADKDLEDQREVLLGYARELAPIAALNVDGVIQDGNVISTPGEPGEPGSQGNALKASVGGLTGMIEIAKAVASGVYDLDAAVALVSDRFGISEEAARRQLGTPTIPNTEGAVDKIEKLTP
jgi:hypothetical protein